MDTSSKPSAETEQTKLEQFVVFVLDSEEYAVPILAVTEVVPTMEVMPVPNAPEYILGLVNLRGRVLPVLDLEKKFHLERQTPAVAQHILFAESEQKTLFGILVDSVKEVIKIPHDTIKPPPDIIKSNIDAEYVPGVIIVESAIVNATADGQTADTSRVLLILDLQKLLSDKNINELRAVQSPADKTADSQPAAEADQE